MSSLIIWHISSKHCSFLWALSWCLIFNEWFKAKGNPLSASVVEGNILCTETFCVGSSQTIFFYKLFLCIRGHWYINYLHCCFKMFTSLAEVCLFECVALPLSFSLLLQTIKTQIQISSHFHPRMSWQCKHRWFMSSSQIICFLIIFFAGSL